MILQLLQERGFLWRIWDPDGVDVLVGSTTSAGTATTGGEITGDADGRAGRRVDEVTSTSVGRSEGLVLRVGAAVLPSEGRTAAPARRTSTAVQRPGREEDETRRALRRSSLRGQDHGADDLSSGDHATGDPPALVVPLVSDGGAAPFGQEAATSASYNVSSGTLKTFSLDVSDAKYDDFILKLASHMEEREQLQHDHADDFIHLVKEVGRVVGLPDAVVRTLDEDRVSAAAMRDSLQRAAVARLDEGLVPAKRTSSPGTVLGRPSATSFLESAKEVLRFSVARGRLRALPEQNCGMSKFPHSVKACSLGTKGKHEVWFMTALSKTKSVKIARFQYSFGAECAGNLAASLGGRLPTLKELKEIVKVDANKKMSKDKGGRIKKFASMNPATWLQKQAILPFKTPTAQKEFAEMSFVNWWAFFNNCWNSPVGSRCLSSDGFIFVQDNHVQFASDECHVCSSSFFVPYP